MDFETPGRLPPLGRVTHHFQAPCGAFFFGAPGARLRMSYAGHEDGSGLEGVDAALQFVTVRRDMQDALMIWRGTREWRWIRGVV